MPRLKFNQALGLNRNEPIKYTPLSHLFRAVNIMGFEEDFEALGISSNYNGY